MTSFKLDLVGIRSEICVSNLSLKCSLLQTTIYKKLNCATFFDRVRCIHCSFFLANKSFNRIFPGVQKVTKVLNSKPQMAGLYCMFWKMRRFTMFDGYKRVSNDTSGNYQSNFKCKYSNGFE